MYLFGQKYLSNETNAPAHVRNSADERVTRTSTPQAHRVASLHFSRISVVILLLFDKYYSTMK